MEKYGEIPPRFTKAWWGYFWEYYKWRVLGVALAVFLIALTIFQCTHRPQYDMTIVYAGHMMYSDKEQEKLCEIASQYIPDSDGNGEQAVMFQPLTFSEGAGNADYDYAIQTKLDLTMIDDGTFIYLMDEIEAVLYMQRDTIADMFEDVQSYAGGSVEEALTADTDGKPYAISLKNSKILKENGIYCDDLYLLVKANYADDEKNMKSHDGAMVFAKALTE